MHVDRTWVPGELWPPEPHPPTNSTSYCGFCRTLASKVLLGEEGGQDQMGLGNASYSRPLLERHSDIPTQRLRSSEIETIGWILFNPLSSTLIWPQKPFIKNASVTSSRNRLWGLLL